MSELQQAIYRLGPAQRQAEPGAPREAAPIPDSAGKAPNGTVSTGGGGGDLTEKDISRRTYHARRTVKSTDGIITVLYDPVEHVVMTDAKGNPVTLTFAAPK